MLGVGESWSPNFVISWSVMLEGPARSDGPPGRCRCCRSEVIQPPDHRVKPRAIDTSGYTVAIRQPSPIWVETPEEHSTDWGISLAPK